MGLRGVYFHGGRRGLHVGMLLTPASVRNDLEALTLQDVPGAAALSHHVYVTPIYEIALFYARSFPGGGAVYSVVASGPVEEDPDFSGPRGESLRCAAATIVRVVNRRVPMWSHEEVVRLLGGPAVGGDGR